MCAEPVSSPSTRHRARARRAKTHRATPRSSRGHYVRTFRPGPNVIADLLKGLEPEMHHSPSSRLDVARTQHPLCSCLFCQEIPNNEATWAPHNSATPPRRDTPLTCARSPSFPLRFDTGHEPDGQKPIDVRPVVRGAGCNYIILKK